MICVFWFEDPVSLTASTAMALASDPKALTNFFPHTPGFTGSPGLLIPTDKQTRSHTLPPTLGTRLLHRCTASVWSTHVVPLCTQYTPNKQHLLLCAL